jgi:hypothetical protein
MTLIEFNALEETEQHAIIWKDAVMVGDKFDGEFRIILYRIFSFYVELYYNLKVHELKKLNSFLSTEIKDSYINQFHPIT